MMFNFDEIIDRRHTYTSKWDMMRLRAGKAGIRFDDETIPMHVADMDFACPPALVAAMHRVADFRIYGYTWAEADSRYALSIIDWYKRRCNLVLEKDWIHFSHGSVTSINCAIETFSAPGEGVIIMPPVYGHFMSMIESDTKRRIASCHLLNRDGYYEIDWNRFESLCAEKSNRIFLLCSPANPVGRVWTKDELARLAEICRRNSVLIISDEIHSDIIRQGVKFTSIYSATDDYRNIIMVNGINKSFNVAGLSCSNSVIADPALRKTFMDAYPGFQPSPFSVAAVIAAYDGSETWLNELNDYLDANIGYAIDYIKQKLPSVKVWRPEGTYMLWLDFRALGLSDAEIHKRIYTGANVILQDGTVHDPEEGACFQRMCLALPRSRLHTALERIGEALR